ncbi:protein yellow-like [Colias croceus]|uniref:protein yellow-like n=1 Tax=Colias crocea TaxID=72248 RepID=UPI001E27BB28|nr:protein yellow-like [Colias croceus]
MAVSQQWFIQWSSPSVTFTDISAKYKNVNPYLEQRDLNVLSFYDQKYTNNERLSPYQYRRRKYYSHLESKKAYQANERSAGVTLWLAMLGLASSQSLPADVDTPPFSTLYKWKYIDFEFPSELHRQRALSSRQYVPDSVLPLGLEVWGSRVWVTLPSWRQGVPATLATVSRFGGVVSPLLRPYPDWSFHRAFNNQNNCSGLTSVFRINVDQCGRLWVLDSGQIDSQDNPKQICPPSIVVFNLQNDELVARYTIPEKYVLQDSLFSNIVVDSRTSDCSDLHVYIADTWRFGLLVFRERDASFWRFSHHLFYPDPLASNYTLHGHNFQWSDGIFGLALSPVNYFQERILYFHSMSSYREFYVKTSVLREPSRVNNSATEFNLLGESRGLFGQSSASAIDRRGVMFYGLVTRDSIACWDTKKPYQKITTGTVARNPETLIFPNDIKVDQSERQSLWVISNRLPIFQEGPLDPEDYNYRIMYVDTIEAVRGTVCDPGYPMAERPIIHTDLWP